MKKILLFSPLLALSIFLTGCSYQSSAPTPSSEPQAMPAETGQAMEQTAVSIKNFAFSPSTLTINAGDTVTWTNNDSVDHTVTMKGTFDSGHIRPGDSWSHTFSESGTYDYICTIHPSMRGHVIVQ